MGLFGATARRLRQSLQPLGNPELDARLPGNADHAGLAVGSGGAVSNLVPRQSQASLPSPASCSARNPSVARIAQANAQFGLDAGLETRLLSR